MRIAKTTVSGVLLASLPLVAFAQSENDLAMQLANPISSLISVPLQSNFDFDVGDDDGFRFTLNTQPVVPFSIGERWTLISRTILPTIYQAGVLPGMGDQFGLGDTVQSLFFSPQASANGLIWGVGPVLLLPTATDDVLGADQWGAGPTGVLLKQQGAWTYGFLTNHIESVGGSDRRPEVKATFLQPFLSRTNGPITYTANFEGSFDHTTDEWTLPLHLTVSKVRRVGTQLVSFGAGLRLFVDAPDNAPQWGIRANITLLYPR
jgi:hypothetical protein